MYKYELKADKYSSHSQILHYLRAQTGRHQLLDVGTAQGELGKGLQGADWQLTGVEINAEWAKAAMPYYDTFLIGDVSQLTLDGQFDYIVFADVLEHLPDPLALLLSVKPLLAPGGQVIVSLPNIANLYVRLKLLAGRFDYEERGICDKTHLRFYTKATASKLVEAAGYRIVRTMATPVPVGLKVAWLRPTQGIGQVPYEFIWQTTKLWPTLFGYQFIFVAEV